MWNIFLYAYLPVRAFVAAAARMFGPFLSQVAYFSYLSSLDNGPLSDVPQPVAYHFILSGVLQNITF